jgi:lipopolysaccharide biosynthesis glycosyltransferase
VTKCKDIVYCFDDGFTQCTLVSALSSIRHTPSDVKIHLFHGPLTDANRTAVIKFCEAYRERALDIDFRDILPEIGGSHITKFALARLVVLMNFDNRVLYLDGDTLIRKDLTELLNMDLGNCAIGAALCPTHLSWWYKSRSSIRPGYHRNSKVVNERLAATGLKDLTTYINSGVLLVDPVRIRELNFAGKFSDLTIAASYRWHDQDHINILLKDYIHLMDSKFNSIWGNLSFKNSVFPSEIKNAQRFAMTDPTIIHFAGKQKPWRLDKVRLGMKIRRLLTRRVEVQFINEWLEVRESLFREIDALL